MTAHPKREALEQFLGGGLSKEEADRIADHLQTEQCMPCLFLAREFMAETEQEVMESLRRFTHPEYPEEERDEGFETAMLLADRRGSVIEAERRHAPELLAELERRAPAAARDAIRTVQRYQLFGLSEHLIDASRELAFRNVAQAIEVAELAVEVADTLDPRIYMPVTTADQRALARACLGNARRVASDLFAAERAFQDSLLIVKEGNLSSTVRADIRSLLGSLRIDQGRYQEARQVLGQALKTYQIFQSKRDEAKILVKLADAEGYSGRPEKGVEILVGALRALEEVAEDRLHLQAQHNLIDWMVDAGQALEALTGYEKARDLYDRHSTEPSLRLRRRWLEGRIYAALGDQDLALDALEEVRRTAAERELSYELAMVSLELALVYLARGESGRVQDLAEEMTVIFRSHELHRHALGAMYLFRQAARTDTATAGLLREILHYLRRARNNPFLRFDPAARWG
ncbi:MAG TPA: hypothetical protein VLF66_18695 [Thermoanaerobaculia bacterium]|nr:hypothetical protein [Thermoanaerobaculia bacterium]